MPRHVREANLSTREARGRLSVAHKPYFRALDEGLHLGYRKSKTGSAWVVRWYVGEGAYKTENLPGRPDDVLTADAATVLNWNQAQSTARKFFERVQREELGLGDTPKGPYTVKNALDDYLVAYERRGGKAVDRTRWMIDAHIATALGGVQLAKLSRRRIEIWLEGLAKAPARVRTKAGKEQKFRKADSSAEAKRRRRSTANRILTVLKAALNNAYHERRVSSPEAWQGVMPFREADAARTRYLTDDEARRLVNRCPVDFRPLVQAALLTGCRYGELTQLRAGDYNADAGTLHVRVSKSGKPRHVVLTEEGQKFFAAVAAGKAGDAAMLVKPDGSAWGTSHQQRPFSIAAKGAKVAPLTFHELRHTYASRLVMNGTPLAVVAAQLGHSDTRMVEKHYGHLAPSYVAETIREKFSELGIVKDGNVKAIGGKGRRGRRGR